MTNFEFYFIIHLGKCLGVPVRLEDGVPSNNSITLRGYNLTLTFSNKNNRFCISRFTKREDAHSISRLVLKTGNYLVKTVTANVC